MQCTLNHQLKPFLLILELHDSFHGAVAIEEIGCHKLAMHMS